mgnify:CR=1 FL=1
MLYSVGMKPENTQSSPQGFEQLPPAPMVNPEAIPTLPRPEVGIEAGGGQRMEQAAEAGAIADVAVAAADVDAIAAGMASQAASQPLVAMPQAPPAGQPAAAPATPLVAADEDLIEKEWVERAKSIIQQTKDDPHARTQQVNELQRGYLEKRFGRVIGSGD